MLDQTRRRNEARGSSLAIAMGDSNFRIGSRLNNAMVAAGGLEPPTLGL